MLPVLIIVLAWWAGAGAVASVKAARASDSEAGTAPGPSTTPQADNITFGQWQHAAYTRWKKRIRSTLPGQHLGKKASDLIGDITAAGIAAAAVFGLGFASGIVWVGGRFAGRSAQQRLRPNRGPFRPGAGPKGPRHRGGRPSTGSGPTPAGGPSGSRTSDAGPQRDSGVIDAEIIDDPAPDPQPATSQYGNAEDAEIIYPQLTAARPDMNGTNVASEILTIHHLLTFSKSVITAARDSAEQSGIRAVAATDRAEQAGLRSGTAIARAEQAGLVATGANEQATQLEATAARFSSLNMDPASMTAIAGGIETASSLARAEQRHAEAEANVAAIAAALAQAEDAAAAAAAEAAKSAIAHMETVQVMHDTVQARQMPHAEAQAATGNAAAHSSVLAVS